MNDAAVTSGTDVPEEPEEPLWDEAPVEPQAATASAAPATTSEARETVDNRTDNPLAAVGSIPTRGNGTHGGVNEV